MRKNSITIAVVVTACLRVSSSWHTAQSYLYSPYSSSSDTIQIVMEPGWNLISLPMLVPDGRTSVLFPSVTSRAYKYTTQYVESETVQAIDPENSDTIFAGRSSGIFVSPNGGANWILSNSGLPIGSSVAYGRINVNPLSTDHLYIVTQVYFTQHENYEGFICRTVNAEYHGLCCLRIFPSNILTTMDYHC